MDLFFMLEDYHCILLPAITRFQSFSCIGNIILILHCLGPSAISIIEELIINCPMARVPNRKWWCYLQWPDPYSFLQWMILTYCKIFCTFYFTWSGLYQHLPLYLFIFLILFGLMYRKPWYQVKHVATSLCQSYHWCAGIPRKMAYETEYYWRELLLWCLSQSLSVPVPLIIFLIKMMIRSLNSR